MLSAHCGICGSKKSNVFKEKEASGLLRSSCLNTPLSKIQ